MYWHYYPRSASHAPPPAPDPHTRAQADERPPESGIGSLKVDEQPAVAPPAAAPPPAATELDIAWRQQRLLDAIARNKIKDLQAAVGDGADVNAAAKDGWTPLMAASKGGRPRLCELLLELGADKAARSTTGRTATDVAITDDLRALLA